VTEDGELTEVVDLLHDEYARSILKETSTQPMSAKELNEGYDTSLTTVYRRVEQLEKAGLITERTRPRPDGHHETVYVASLDELSIRLRDGELEFEIERRDEDAADRLTDLWGRF
jgi:DNA-binding HxlR family transcriptional regulator